MKRIVAETGRVFETLQHYACRLAIRDSERAEELRVLYVAMTRARERLIMVGSSENPDSLVKKCGASLCGDKTPSPVLIKKAGSYLEILILSLMWHKDAKLLREFAAVSERYTYNPNFSLNVEYVTSVSTGEYITEDEDAVALMKICSGILKNGLHTYTDILVFPDMPQKCLRLQSKTARAVLIGILQPSLTFCVKMI